MSLLFAVMLLWLWCNLPSTWIDSRKGSDFGATDELLTINVIILIANYSEVIKLAAKKHPDLSVTFWWSDVQKEKQAGHWLVP